MLFSINDYGGVLLIMMGQNTRSESLFHYFRLEDHIPENHLLRLVDRHIGFAFVRETLKASYSHTGRPSIDPEVLVWRLDRRGRSVADLAVTLKELSELGVAFVSLTEALDLTTPSGRAMAGLLSVFAEFEREVLRERILAGLAQAESEEHDWDGRGLHLASRMTSVSYLAKAFQNPKLHGACQSAEHLSAGL